MYQFDHGKQMSTPAVAQLLSNTLYYRRFFPYYTFNLLAGLDEEGRGAVYGYDAVGSYKRDEYGAMGSGQNFIVPLLDNLVGHKNRGDERTELTREQAIAIAKECFVTAGERDIYTGDSVRIAIVDSTGIHEEIFELKKD
jgi:20S proteasome subunit beta 6